MEINIKDVAVGFKTCLNGVAYQKWVAGDYLIKEGINSSALIRALASEVGVESSTVKIYRDVSAEFPEERRNYDLAWGVFKQLARVDDTDWQDKFLANNPDATASKAELAVNAELRRRRAGRRPARNKETGRVFAGGVTLDLSVRQDTGSGSVEFKGVDSVEVRFSEMTGLWAVDFITT